MVDIFVVPGLEDTLAANCSVIRCHDVEKNKHRYSKGDIRGFCYLNEELTATIITCQGGDTH